MTDFDVPHAAMPASERRRRVRPCTTQDRRRRAAARRCPRGRQAGDGAASAPTRDERRRLRHPLMDNVLRRLGCI